MDGTRHLGAASEASAFGVHFPNEYPVFTEPEDLYRVFYLDLRFQADFYIPSDVPSLLGPTILSFFFISRL